MMIETAAETDELKAVVSEGAGARMYSEDLDHDDGSLDKVVGGPVAALKSAAIAVFSNQAPPANLKDLAAKIDAAAAADRRAQRAHRREAQPRVPRARRAPTQGSGRSPSPSHVGGLAARPAEYERRVVGFFDEALGR